MTKKELEGFHCTVEAAMAASLVFVFVFLSDVPDAFVPAGSPVPSSSEA